MKGNNKLKGNRSVGGLSLEGRDPRVFNTEWKKGWR